MTVVDAHTHIPDERFARAVGPSPEAFLATCDRHDVDMAWVFPTLGLSDPHPRHNDAVGQFCAAAPERLVPFCTVHPHLPGAVRELRRAVEEGGARGLKLHPWLQGFSPVDPCMDEVGEAAAHMGIPVVFHDGTPPNSSPLQIAWFAERHPGIPVVLGHGGLHDLWVEALAAAARVPNVWIVPSGTPPVGLRRMVERLGTSRLLFGSDAGYGEPHWQAFQLQKIGELRLDDEQHQAVLGGNALRLLDGHEERNGVPPPAGASPSGEASSAGIAHRG